MAASRRNRSCWVIASRETTSAPKALRKSPRRAIPEMSDEELDARFWEVMDRLRGSERRDAVDVREVAKNTRRVFFENWNVPIVNAPQVDISELLDHLARNDTFAMGWWQRGDGEFQYSLRSRGDFDVSELAKKYGGGGHKNAAGFEQKEMLKLRKAP